MKDEEVWLRAWLSVAPSFNAKVNDCTRYADECLKAYRERFPTRQPEGGGAEAARDARVKAA